MKILSVLINVLVGLVFAASAAMKMYPIEYFEIKISGFGITNEILIGVAARLIIAFEFTLGILLLFQFLHNGRLQRLIQLVLVGFILINVIDIIQTGNSGNCGCFGEKFQMTPLESIIKNVVMLLLLEISRRKSSFQLNWKLKWSLLFTLLISMTSLLFYRPVYVNEIYLTNMKGKPLELEVMNGHEGLKGKTYNEDITKGKRVVAFLSLTCHYCKLSGYRLSIIKNKHPEIPMYFIINGDSVNIPQFDKFTNSMDIPRAHFNGSDDFMKLSGFNLPAVYLIEDKIIYSKETYSSLTEQKIVDWYKSE